MASKKTLNNGFVVVFYPLQQITIIFHVKQES